MFLDVNLSLILSAADSHVLHLLHSSGNKVVILPVIDLVHVVVNISPIHGKHRTSLNKLLAALLHGRQHAVNLVK